MVRRLTEEQKRRLIELEIVQASDIEARNSNEEIIQEMQDEGIESNIAEVEKMINDMDSFLIESFSTKKHARYSHRGFGRITSETSQTPNRDEMLTRKYEDIVNSLKQFSEKFGRVAFNAVRAILNIKESIMKAYEKIHADPYEKTIDYMRTGAEAGKEFEEKDIELMYNRYKTIGKIERDSEAELIGRVGFRGTIGEVINKSSNAFFEYLTDTDSIDDEDIEKNNIDMKLKENYRMQTE